MQWVKVPSQSNIHNLKNVRCKISRHFSTKKKEYLKDKIEERETISKTPTVFWVGGLTISRLLNIHEVNDVRQTEIYTAEPLVPEPSAFEFELAIEKLQSCKSPGIDQIPA
jgi:hypothetical protein